MAWYDDSNDIGGAEQTFKYNLSLIDYYKITGKERVK